MNTAKHETAVISFDRSRHVHSQLAYWFGDFVLLPALFALRVRARPVPIAPKVFDLILYLIRNRDHVVTHAELHAALWPDVVVTEASLTYAVMAARRVLGDSGRDQMVIRSVRARGYRFVAEVAEGYAP